MNTEAQEEKIQKMAQCIYDHVYGIEIYSSLTLYAVNKEVNLVPMKFDLLRLWETSLIDNRWSVREETQQSVAD